MSRLYGIARAVKVTPAPVSVCTLPVEIRRRRAASRGMPTLPYDHRRDPLDPAPGDQRPVIKARVGQRSVRFFGDARAVLRAANATGAPAMRHPKDWAVVSVPEAHADDVISQLRYGQPSHVVHVTVDDAEPPT